MQNAIWNFLFRREHNVVVALFLYSVLTAVFVFLGLLVYSNALLFGFNSDSFALIAKAKTSFLDAIQWDGGYHYRPLSVVWLRTQYILFGDEEKTYQIFNVIQHSLMCVFVCLLARILKLGVLFSVLASVLYLCAGNSYQVTLWSICGSYYFLSGCLYVLSVICFILALERKSLILHFATSLLYMMALFAHPQALTAVVLYALWFSFRYLDKDALGFRGFFSKEFIFSFIRSLIGPALIAFCFVILNIAIKQPSTIEQNSLDFYSQIYFLLKGLISTLLLRGDETVVGLATLSLLEFFDDWWIALISLVVLLGVLIVCNKTVKFLVFWILVHLSVMQVGIGVSPRHTYLPTVASCILVTYLLEQLLRKSRSKQTFILSSVIVVLSLAFLIRSSLRDVQAAVGVWSLADSEIANFKNVLLEAPPRADSHELYVLNSTKEVLSPQFQVYTFHTSTNYIVGSSRSFSGVKLVHTPGVGNYPPKSKLISRSELTKLFEQLDVSVLMFDRVEKQFQWLDREDFSSVEKRLFADSSTVGRFSIDTAPEYGWIQGDPPWINLHPGNKLEVELEIPNASEFWFSLYYVAQVGREIDVYANSKFVGKAAAQNSPVEQWTHFTSKLSVPKNSETIQIRLESRGKIPANFSQFFILPLAQPLERGIKSSLLNNGLVLNEGKELELAVGTSLLLPLGKFDNSNCRIAFLSERDLRQQIEFNNNLLQDGSIRSKVEERKVGWLTLLLPPLEFSQLIIANKGPNIAIFKDILLDCIVE